MQSIDKIHYINHRWLNWSDYISFIQWDKRSDFCILILCYGSIQNIHTLIQYIQKEKNRQSYDLVIIDNSHTSQKSLLLLEDSCNIIYIRPNENLWSAGWYALGMEYAINQWYHYLVMIEDDVILLDQGIIDSFYESKAQQVLSFINSCQNTWWEHSRYVQCACYPTHFIQNIGIINPTYFFRCEDLEWKLRIQKGIQQYGMQKHIIDKNYLHPYLKKINGSVSWSYFSLRNQLMMLYEHMNRNTTFFVTFFLYIRNSISRFVQWHGSQYIQAWFFAFYDFVMWYSSQIHMKRIEQLSKKYRIEAKEEKIWYADFVSRYSNYWSIGTQYQLSQIDIDILGIHDHIIHFITKWAIIGWRNSILFPFYSLAPEIVSIDEFILWTDMIYISTKKNSVLPGIIYFVFSFLISVFLFWGIWCVLLLIIIFRFLWFLKSQ